jgi:peroxiredoxin
MCEKMVISNYLKVLIGICLLVQVPIPLFAEKDVFTEYAIALPDRVETAPMFSLPDLAGEIHHLADLKGKIVLVNFWATWCVQCIREMPHFQKILDILGNEKFEIVAIDVKDPQKRVEKFLKSKSYTFQVLLDTKGEVYKSYGVRGFPTTYILNDKNQFIGQVVGARDWSAQPLVDYLSALIKEIE